MRVTARHTITGIVDDYPQNIIDHPILGQYLVPIDRDTLLDIDTETHSSGLQVIESSDVAEVEDEDEVEEKKVVRDKRVYAKVGSATDTPEGADNESDK